MKRSTIISVLAAVAAGGLLGGCDPQSSMVRGAEASATRQIQGADAATCASYGGEMQPVGRMQTLQCVIRYSDAGKACRSGDQCAGDCRIEDAPFPAAGARASGRCQADSSRFGCHTTVENGRATAAICID